MTTLYVPGGSPMHRLAAGWKLLGLFAIALALSLMTPSWWVVGLSVAVPAACYAVSGLAWRHVRRDLRQMVLLVVFMAAVQLLFMDPLVAVSNTMRVVAVVLLAQVLTRTTRVQAMIDVVQTALGPLRPLGVSPEKIGLAMALALTSIGQISAIIAQVRDAQRTRGVRLAPWSWLVPVLVLTLRHADDVGDALDARGVV